MKPTWHGAEKLRTLLTPIDALENDERNARAHDERSYEAIRASLKKFGQRKPIVVDGEVVIAGNGTLVAARREGWTHIATVDADGLTAEEKRAYALADNRTAELSSWDYGALHVEMQELQETMPLLDLGWTPAEVKAVTRRVSIDPIDSLDGGGQDSGQTVQPESRVGDVYELGRHRLAVGDASDKAFVRAVVGVADLVVTDPPYGISYVGKTKDAMQIANDDLGGEALTDFLRLTLGAASLVSKPGACWYVFAPPGPTFLSFAVALTELGIWRQTLVWEKSALVMGHSDYHYRHEALFYGWVPGVGHATPLDRTQDSVWLAKKPVHNKQHPTMKPTELYERAMLNSSCPDDVVFDAFGGSGTAIIAAETTGRIARVTELSPAYADGIRRRWTTFARDRGIDPGPGALD